MKKILRYAFAVLIIAAVVALGIFLWKHFYGEKKEIKFSTEKVQRGRVASTISASGTVEPLELINVGAQVNGKIMNFGIDADGKEVDYCSRVTKGMLLAEIDEVLYDAALREANASKLQAEVKILSAIATLNQEQAKLNLAERNWARAQELQPKGSFSKSDYDSAEAEFLICKANIEVAKASLQQAEAQRDIAQAALVKAERNLSYCKILSPIDGIIIDRRVSVGQTLVSSMSTSSIFLIAADLKKMQVWASVNEADIGDIKIGMPVVFTVDTFPGEEFQGTVSKIRLNATMSQNVVTYVVEIDTDNSNGRLMPYLTANVKFIKAQRDNVFVVSTAALRYRPDKEVIAPEYADKLGEYTARGKRVVWVLGKDQKVRPIEVQSGLSSGSTVEVSSPQLTEGMEIVNAHRVIDLNAQKEDKNGEKSSPFANKPPTQVRNSAKAAKGK